MNTFTKIPAASAIFIASSLAHAHPGPRVFLGTSGGQVTTFLGNNNENSTAFTPTRIFPADLPNAFGSGTYTTDFPGFQVVEGTGVAPGTTFSFSIAGPLYYFSEYNPTTLTGVFLPTAQAFAGSPVPQMAVSETSSFTITGSAAVPGFEFFGYNAPGDHGHLTFTLLGNGSLPAAGGPEGPDGVYALPLEVTGTSLSTSATFYLLFGKNEAIGSTQFDTAVAVANAQFIPEPGVALLAVPLAFALLRRR